MKQRDYFIWKPKNTGTKDKHHDDSGFEEQSTAASTDSYSIFSVICGIASLLLGWLSTKEIFRLTLLQYLTPGMKFAGSTFNQHAPVLMPLFNYIKTLSPLVFKTVRGVSGVFISVMWSLVYFLLGTAVHSLITKGKWRKGVAIAIIFNLLVLLMEPSLRYACENLGLGNTFPAAFMIPALALCNFYLNYSDPLSQRAFRVMFLWSTIACNLVSIVNTTVNNNVLVNFLLTMSLLMVYLF
jgi:hypothetical protein